jgi:hypothetical protein
MIFEWLKLYRERSGKLCHEEMAEVFGGDFSKDGEFGIGRRISSRGFPETGLSGVGWGTSTSLGGCMVCYIFIVGSWGNYAVWLRSCFLGGVRDVGAIGMSGALRRCLAALQSCFSFTEVRTYQNGIVKICHSDICIGEVCTREVLTFEIASSEILTREVLRHI